MYLAITHFNVKIILAKIIVLLNLFDLYSLPLIPDLRKGHIRKRNRDGPRPLQDIYR